MRSYFKPFAVAAFAAVLALTAPLVAAQGKGETVKFQDYPGLASARITSSRVTIPMGLAPCSTAKSG